MPRRSKPRRRPRLLLSGSRRVRSALFEDEPAARAAPRASIRRGRARRCSPCRSPRPGLALNVRPPRGNHADAVAAWRPAFRKQVLRARWPESRLVEAHARRAARVPAIEQIVVVAPSAARGSDAPARSPTSARGRPAHRRESTVRVSPARRPIDCCSCRCRFAGAEPRGNRGVPRTRASASRPISRTPARRRNAHRASFPDVPHTWAHLREGTFCGGGCFAIRPRVFPPSERFLDRLGAARKTRSELAAIFGYDVLAGYRAPRLNDRRGRTPRKRAARGTGAGDVCSSSGDRGQR